MAKPFQLEILTPERAFYRGECISVIVPVSDGMLGIMANHTPMTAAITDGEVVFTLPGRQQNPLRRDTGNDRRFRRPCSGSLRLRFAPR